MRLLTFFPGTCRLLKASFASVGLRRNASGGFRFVLGLGRRKLIPREPLFSKLPHECAVLFLAHFLREVRAELLPHLNWRFGAVRLAALKVNLKLVHRLLNEFPLLFQARNVPPVASDLHRNVPEIPHHVVRTALRQSLVTILGAAASFLIGSFQVPVSLGQILFAGTVRKLVGSLVAWGLAKFLALRGKFALDLRVWPQQSDA